MIRRRFFFGNKHRKEEVESQSPPTETMQHTRVVPMRHVPIEPTAIVPQETTSLCHNSPLVFRLCGRTPIDNAILQESSPYIPDDPTVEESIECVIAASQGELADLLKDSVEYPVTPSCLQQSLLKNRSFERMPAQFQSEARHRSPQTAYRSVPYDTIAPNQESVAVETVDATKTCSCCQTSQPVDPALWPQRPLLMRPTPNSGTIVRGIRRANRTEYLWTPDSKHSWMEGSMGCRQCASLPINSGDEIIPLVTDFESELFIGSLLLRVRGSRCVSEEQLEQGYFHGLNRRYQVVIRGRFKREIPWTECYSGFQYVLNGLCSNRGTLMH